MKKKYYSSTLLYVYRKVRMQKKKNSDIQFTSQTVLKGSFKGTSFYKRRIPEFAKIVVPSQPLDNKWIQKDLKYKITKWSVSKLYLPTPRSMGFENIDTISH